jgi:hypothetical protein
MINITPAAFRGQPIPGRIVTAAQWEHAACNAARGPLILLSLWATEDAVQMALLDPAAKSVGILSVDARSGKFPSVSRLHSPAQRLERTIRDLHGLLPEGEPDTRPWLAHGRLGRRYPLGAAGRSEGPVAYVVLPV